MIPYIDYSRHGRPFRAENPFVEEIKPLRVFVDRATVQTEEIEFLLRQADAEKILLISTEREGNAYLEYETEAGDPVAFSVYESDGTERSRHGIRYLAQYKRMASSPDWNRWASPAEIERALVVAKTAESLNAHIFITNDKFLLEHNDIGIIKDAYPLNVTDATALIGLINRMHNNFTIVIDRTGPATMSTKHGRWSFFWYASRDLLPSAWRLVTGCAQFSDTDKYRDLALTAISRTSNALKCRDHIHQQIFLEQSNSSTEDAIFYLEYYLISFTAAFDVLARVVDGIYNPIQRNGRPIRPLTWRNSDWLNGISLADPILAASMQPEAFNRDVLEFLARLRNYIHAEGLQGAMHSKDGRPAPILLQVPAPEADSIVEIINRIGNGEWTFDRRYHHHGTLSLEIGDVVERLTPLVISALDNLMSLIDVTRIPGYDPSRTQTEAPEKWPSKKELLDIRKLLGL